MGSNPMPSSKWPVAEIETQARAIFMNELHFPLRLLENADGSVTLCVSHEDNWSWGSTKIEQDAMRDKTRKFCNWIRKQYPHVPTEFRYLAKKRVRNHSYRSWSPRAYRTVNSDKHFVAYNMTKNELLMIKLAWSYTTQVAALSGGNNYPTGTYIIEAESIEPTVALRKRLEKKSPSKQLKTK